MKNLAADLGQVRDARVKARRVGFFYSANAASGTRLAKAVGIKLDDAKATLAPLASRHPRAASALSLTPRRAGLPVAR